MHESANTLVLSEIRRINPNARLIAATKYADVEKINELLSQGVDAIGENRLQDAERKFPFLTPCEKHFFGTVQSGKIGKLVRFFDVIQSLDSLDHAKKMDRAAAGLGKKIRVLVQVNAGSEAQKGGLLPEKQKLAAFLNALHPLAHLVVNGLMIVVPQGKGDLFFPKAKNLFDSLKDEFGLSELSMGTSDDYLEALKNGATMVRIGRVLFEPR